MPIKGAKNAKKGQGIDESGSLKTNKASLPFKVERIVVDNLFGMYDYDIKPHDGLTLIHGLNGQGKTTTLKMLNAVFSYDISVLLSIPYDSFEVYLNTGIRFVVKQTDESKSNDNHSFYAIGSFADLSVQCKSLWDFGFLM